MNKILSIIIPVYNAEKYIQKCLESIFLNLNNDIEVIIIDDGSTDNSLNLIKKLIEKSSVYIKNNIKLLTQCNQGQSAARNNAIAISKGDYIAFIDADDCISSTYIKEILSIIEIEKPDLIKIGAKKFLINENQVLQELKFNNFNDTGLKYINSKLQKHLFNESHWYACLTIIRKKLIVKKFPIGIYFEDAVFMTDIYLRARNIYFLPDKIYYYRHHVESSLNSISKLNIQKIDESYSFCLNYFSSKINEDDVYGITYITFLKAYCIFLLDNRKMFKSFLIHCKNKKNIKKVKFKLLTKKSITYYRKGGYSIILLLFIKGLLN